MPSKDIFVWVGDLAEPGLRHSSLVSEYVGGGCEVPETIWEAFHIVGRILEKEIELVEERKYFPAVSEIEGNEGVAEKGFTNHDLSSARKSTALAVGGIAA